MLNKHIFFSSSSSLCRPHARPCLLFSAVVFCLNHCTCQSSALCWVWCQGRQDLAAGMAVGRPICPMSSLLHSVISNHNFLFACFKDSLLQIGPNILFQGPRGRPKKKCNLCRVSFSAWKGLQSFLQLLRSDHSTFQSNHSVHPPVLGTTNTWSQK